MDNIIIGVLSWALFFIMHRFVVKRINKLAKKKNYITCLSKEEYSEEAYPKKYKYYYIFFVLIFCLIAVLGGIGIGLGLLYFQKLVFKDPNVLLFTTTGVSYFIFFMSGLFIFAPFAALVMSFITHRFPNFEKYVIMRNYKSGVHPLDYNYQNTLFLKTGIIILLITFPLIFAAFFNYVNLTTEKVYYNKILSLNEDIYDWKDVNYVEVSCKTRRDNRDSSKINLEREYILNFSDGSKINLWDSFGFMKVALDVDRLIYSKGISVHINRLDYCTYSELTDRFKNTELEPIYEGILKIQLGE